MTQEERRRESGMTQEERWREYGRMIGECLELKSTLMALTNKAEQHGRALHYIADALVEGKPCPPINVEIIADAASIVELLDQIERCKERLERLNVSFRKMGLEFS